MLIFVSLSMKECKLHIALHGCVQQKEKVGNVYAANSGYNQVADLNDIVILYPQAKASSGQMNRKIYFFNLVKGLF